MKFHPNYLKCKNVLIQRTNMKLQIFSTAKWIAIYIVYASSALAYPDIALANKNINSDDIPFNLSYSNEDIKFGTEITNTFTNLQTDKVEKKEIDELRKLSSKTKIFRFADAFIDRLELVKSINDQDSFYKSCLIKSKNVNEFTESIEERLNIALDSYCRNIFLKRLVRFSPSINLSTRDINFFKEAAPFYLNGENAPAVSAFLRHFRSNAEEHEKLSGILIEKALELRIRPPSNIITSIKVSAKFNQFLQSNINLEENSASYFNEEFQRTIRDLQDALEKGDYNLAKQYSNGAIRFYNQNKLFISDKRAFVGLVIAAKAFYYKGKDKDATELFERAREIAPKEEFSDAHFYLVWQYIIEKDTRGLKKAIDKYNLEKDFEKFDSKLQYWIAYAELKSGETKKATDYFNKIISSSPYSFYTIVALKDLSSIYKGKMSEDEILSKLISKNNPVEFSPEKFSNLLKESLKRFAVWNKIGNERFQTLELRYIQSLPKEDTFNDFEIIKKTTNQSQKEFIALNLIKLLNSKKRYITAFRIFQDSVEQNSLTLNIKLIKQIFPLSYFDIIKKNALNLDPLIIISLIRQESAFNPEANSGVGAKGLMQLMPATAKRFNKKVKPKHLADPEINVALGTKYLRQLITRFDGNLIYALASYNAGENRIDKWRRDIFKTDDPLATIESIPFEETRNYVKLIYRNYFFYNVIHNKSILKTPIEDSFKVTELR